ncbi:unnamed protein product [Fusarium venenatum]|uniref:Uncharacterized protein n=1 Tax=Fusarium venenatum TaxID=56646 RepID=A0A2L2TNV4_9HYPO|nr:uncharacterized protein FVRRES_03943 [Fusarium venenatum]CEI67431.1 unnamed protein product [Fusarium venenatum]
MPPLRSPQRDLKHLSERPFLEGRLFAITLCWPSDHQILPKHWRHLSYCVVEFPTKEMTQEATNRIPALEFEGSLLQVSVPKAASDPAQTTNDTTERPVTCAPTPTDSTAGKPVVSAPMNLPHGKGSITMSSSNCKESG